MNMTWDFLITAMIVVLAPGTGVVYTVSTGLIDGRAMSIAAVFGCTLGILPAILATIFGVAALMHTSALAFSVVKYAGAAYLFYLAVQALRAAGPSGDGINAATPRRALAIVRDGFLINILNPKLTVFFFAFLPQFVDPAVGSPTAQMLVLSGIFMAMTFVVFVVYGTMAAHTRRFILGSEKAMRWMRRTVALAFAGFALRLALSDR